jgi:tetratricopeptide (TPR) repeat protein
MGEDQPALESFTSAAQLDGGFTECFYRMAQLARRVGQNELARSSMIRFKELQQIGNGDPDIPKQMKKLRASILNAPESPLHHEKLGLFFAQHDYVNEAENLYRLTGQLPRVKLDRLTRMGKHMLQLNRPETALFLFQQGSKKQPQHIPTLLNAGVALEMLGKNTEAQIYYRRVQGLAPQDPRGWYAMGLSEFNADRLEEAEAAWEKSLQLTPKSSPLRREIERRLTDLPTGK